MPDVKISEIVANLIESPTIRAIRVIRGKMPWLFLRLRRRRVAKYPD